MTINWTHGAQVSLGKHSVSKSQTATILLIHLLSSQPFSFTLSSSNTTLNTLSATQMKNKMNLPSLRASFSWISSTISNSELHFLSPKVTSPRPGVHPQESQYSLFSCCSRLSRYLPHDCSGYYQYLHYHNHLISSKDVLFASFSLLTWIKSTPFSWTAYLFS